MKFTNVNWMHKIVKERAMFVILRLDNFVKAVSTLRMKWLCVLPRIIKDEKEKKQNYDLWKNLCLSPFFREENHEAEVSVGFTIVK